MRAASNIVVIRIARSLPIDLWLLPRTLGGYTLTLSQFVACSDVRWSGTMWASTGCQSTVGCETATCLRNTGYPDGFCPPSTGPTGPVTKAEFTLVSMVYCLTTACLMVFLRCIFCPREITLALVLLLVTRWFDSNIYIGGLRGRYASLRCSLLCCCCACLLRKSHTYLKHPAGAGVCIIISILLQRGNRIVSF